MMNILRVLIFMLCCMNGQAAEFLVTTTDDTVDASLADGICADINGECSLRAAIMQANILGTDEVIYLTRGASYVLTLVDDIDSQSANDLDVFDSVTISVANPEVPIEDFSEMPSIAVDVDGSIEDRVFEIHNGALISFHGLWVGYGAAENSLSNPRLGGGIYVSDQVTEFRISDSIVAFNQAGYGAGIYSKAQVTVIESTDISYNTINIPALITLGAAGAGVYHDGSILTVNKSSIHHNLVDEVGFFLSALFMEGEDSQVEVLNTIIAENGVWPSGVSGVVNGIGSRQANLRVNNSNLTGNTGVGIQFNSDAEHKLILRNTVLAFNLLDDCGDLTGEQDFGGPLHPAHIITSDASCSLPDLASNRQNVDPSLSVLAGRFEVLDFQFFSTQFPMIGSVLIDSGSRIEPGSGHVSACEKTDIRGVSRPLNGAGLFNQCDVGIYESDDLIFLDDFDFID